MDHSSRPDLSARRPRPAVDRRRRALVAAGAALGLGAVLGRAGTGLAAPAACGVPPREPAPFAHPDPDARWAAPPGPTVTTVALGGGAYRYEVNGWPETIRGMGYNPPEGTGDLAARRQRLERDLGLMVASGVNTLIGWNPAVMDALTLDVAHAVGLGVALPFDVDFTSDMRDASVRADFLESVLRWVDLYRAHPALRIWAVGNEVLQRSVPPTWCGTPPSREQGEWSAAWSDLLLATADAIHARDPYHPVLYREAEDSYTSWLARVIAERPASRPWLIYGVNAYTPRLAEIIEQWPERGIPSPLLVSEYAPLNGVRWQRADQFRSIWQTIRAYPSYVLGGAVYVWSTDGPEEVDRQFGLVDEYGVPVDDALDTIAALYHADARSARGVTPGGPTV